jgi:uncharacterized protein (TIGR02145 family)
MKKITSILFSMMAVVMLVSCEKDPQPEPEPTPVDPENPAVLVMIPDAVTDIEGHHYDAVQIGSQVWMAQNLRAHRYADSTAIPYVVNTSGLNLRLYYPDNDVNNVEEYGYLYNWTTAVRGVSSGSDANPSGVQGVCPDGWHLPSDAEWTQLTDYLSQHHINCGDDPTAIAKALACSTGWKVSYAECAVGNTPEYNNTTGFSARPAGTYTDGCVHFGEYARFWSSTDIEHGGDLGDNPVVWPAFYRGIYYHSATVGRGTADKGEGCSVRCVRN